jgi:hypothetical protein
MKTLKPIIIVMLCVALASCGEQFLGPDSENTPEKNFELLWEDFDKTYSHFEIKKIDWDSLYAEYRPQVTSETTGQELFSIMSAMLAHLNDGHVNLWTQYGEYHRTFNLDSYYYRIPLSIIKSRYLTTYKEINDTIVYGQLTSDLGYIYIRTFDGTTESFKMIDKIMEEFKGFKGIVVDVRDNGGGVQKNSGIIASRFADRKRLFDYIQWRNGPKHSDFTEPLARYIEPTGKIQFTKPVALLTNRGCFSSAEIFTLMMREFPHVTVVGGTTAGSTGFPESRGLPNGWVYSVPTWIELTPEKEPYENIGLVPDVPVFQTASDSQSGKDTILEKAIQMLEQ